MNDPEYPKLHLPPWFYEEGWEEMIQMKDWVAVGFIELSEGEFVRPTFITLERINSDMTHSEQDYYFDRDMIILKKVSIDEIKRLLPILANSRVFNGMQRYERIVWD